MILAQTARAISAELSSQIKLVTRRSLDDLKISAAKLALDCGVSSSIAEDWCREESQRHVPLYLVAHPKLPQAFRVRLAAEVLALAERNCPRQSSETATGLLLGVAGDAVSALAKALADGRVEEHEVADLRPVIRSLRDRCDRWLQNHPEQNSTATGVYPRAVV